MRDLPSLTRSPAVGPEPAVSTELGGMLRGRASDIVVRWRRSFPTAAPSADDRDLTEVVHSVAKATEHPHDLDGISRRVAESLVAVFNDLPQVLRNLGLLREALLDLLAEQNADPAVRRRIDKVVDALAEAAAAIITERLNEVAFADPLTRLPNRRALDRDLTREIARASRRRLGLTVVLGDLDGLKQINDRLGHAAGDQALQALADGLRGALRGEDCAYRIGGDEFVVLLPDASCADAELVMARAKAAGAPEFSWGAATYPGDGADGAAVLEVADRRLFESRAQPRRPSPSPAYCGSATPRRVSRGGQLARLATVMIGGALLGGGGVAAADGTLPPPMQHVVHVALDRVSVEVPPATARPIRSPGERDEQLGSQGRVGGGPAAGGDLRPPLPGNADGETIPCQPAGPGGEQPTDRDPDTARCAGPSGTGPAKAAPYAEEPVQDAASRETGPPPGTPRAPVQERPRANAAGDAPESPARGAVKSGAGKPTAGGDEDRKPAGRAAGGGHDATENGGARAGAAPSG